MALGNAEINVSVHLVDVIWRQDKLACLLKIPRQQAYHCIINISKLTFHYDNIQLMEALSNQDEQHSTSQTMIWDLTLSISGNPSPYLTLFFVY